MHWQKPNDEIYDHCLTKIKQLNRQRMKRVWVHVSFAIGFTACCALTPFISAFFLPAVVFYLFWYGYSLALVFEDDSMLLQKVIVILANMSVPPLTFWSVAENDFFWVPLVMMPICFSETWLIFGKHFMRQFSIQKRSFLVQEVTVSELKINKTRSGKSRTSFLDYKTELTHRVKRDIKFHIAVDFVSLKNTADGEQGYLILTEKDFNKFDKKNKIYELVEKKGFYL